MGMITSYEHPRGGKVRVVAPAVKMSETPATIELRYVVAKGIARCFSDDEFRDAVQARLADHSFASP